MSTLTLKVVGMSCQHCVHAVTSALQGVDGVSRANVDLQAGRAVVEYDESRADPDTFVRAIEQEGYEAAAA